MKKGVFISLFLIITLACSFTNQIPTTQTPAKNGSDPTQKRPNESNPSQTSTLIQDSPSSSDVLLKWSWNTRNLGVVNPGSVEDLNDSGTEFLYILKDGLNGTTNQTRYLFQQEYYHDNTSVYFLDENEIITRIDINSGDLIWQSDLKGEIIGVGPNTVIVYRDDNRIYGLDISNGEEKWKIIIEMLLSEDEEGGPFLFSQYYMNEFIVPMSTDCSGYRNVRFLHIDETTGNHWLTECNPDNPAENIFAFVNGIFIAEDILQSNFAGYNPQDGSVVWKLFGEEEGKHTENLTIREFNTGNNQLYIENFDVWYNELELIGIDLTTGNKVWGNGIFDMNGLPNSSNSNQQYMSQNLYISKNYIYFFTHEEIFVFLKDNGALINKISQERSNIPYFSDNGMILYYPELGIAKGINPLTSEILWENDEFPNMYSYYSYADIIMFRDQQTNGLVAIDQKTGEELWRNQINMGLLGDAPNLGSSKGLIIYYNRSDYNCGLLDPYSGNIQVIYDHNPYSIEPLDENTWLMFSFTGILSLIEYK